MNSIKQATSGLASSLFLAAGFTRLAEKMDPMLTADAQALTIMRDPKSCNWSDVPCYFTPETGQ